MLLRGDVCRRAKKARCQVVLNEEQTDVFALRPSLDAAPCKKYWQLFESVNVK